MTFQAAEDSPDQAAQDQLSTDGPLRVRDRVVSIGVTNKTYGDRTSTLPLADLRSNGPTSVFVDTNANLNAIMAQSG